MSRRGVSLETLFLSKAITMVAIVSFADIAELRASSLPDAVT
jgi:hypothetical protein